MTPKRKAHFLSRFFLGGFTKSGSATDVLHVRSKKQEKSWQTRAENAGHQRDLFKPEGVDVEPDEIEDAFAEVESQVAPVLRRVVETERLPEGRDLDMLLHLIALNGARPPAEMANVEQNLDANLRKMLVETMTPEVHQRILRQWKEDGRDTAYVEDLEALKDRILAGGVRAVVDRDYFLVHGVLGRAAVLVDLLALRSWTLLRADGDSEFICSDRPVILLNNQNLSHGVQPRYDDPRFDVIMPLSRKLCLVGHSYGPSGTRTASTRTVGFINYITESSAGDYVYSATGEYLVADEVEFDIENGRAYRGDLGVR